MRESSSELKKSMILITNDTVDVFAQKMIQCCGAKFIYFRLHLCPYFRPKSLIIDSAESNDFRKFSPTYLTCRGKKFSIRFSCL